MELLLRNPGRVVFSREPCSMWCVGYELRRGFTDVTCMCAACGKSWSWTRPPQYILTKWGVGYYLKSRRRKAIKHRRRKGGRAVPEQMKKVVFWRSLQTSTLDLYLHHPRR